MSSGSDHQSVQQYVVFRDGATRLLKLNLAYWQRQQLQKLLTAAKHLNPAIQVEWDVQ